MPQFYYSTCFMKITSVRRRFNFSRDRHFTSRKGHWNKNYNVSPQTAVVTARLLQNSQATVYSLTARCPDL